jgi:hypothetical protein
MNVHDSCVAMVVLDVSLLQGTVSSQVLYNANCLLHPGKLDSQVPRQDMLHLAT